MSCVDNDDAEGSLARRLKELEKITDPEDLSIAVVSDIHEHIKNCSSPAVRKEALTVAMRHLRRIYNMPNHDSYEPELSVLSGQSSQTETLIDMCGGAYRDPKQKIPRLRSPRAEQPPLAQQQSNPPFRISEPSTVKDLKSDSEKINQKRSQSRKVNVRFAPVRKQHKVNLKNGDEDCGQGERESMDPPGRSITSQPDLKKKVESQTDLKKKVDDKEGGGKGGQLEKESSAASFLFFMPQTTAQQQKVETKQRDENLRQVEKKDEKEIGGTSSRCSTSGAAAQEQKNDTKQGVDNRGQVGKESTASSFWFFSFGTVQEEKGTVQEEKGSEKPGNDTPDTNDVDTKHAEDNHGKADNKSSGPSFRFFSSRAASSEKKADTIQGEFNDTPVIDSADTKHAEDNHGKADSKNSGHSFRFFSSRSASSEQKADTIQGEVNGTPAIDGADTKHEGDNHCKTENKSNGPSFRFFSSRSASSEQKVDSIQGEVNDTPAIDGADTKHADDNHGKAENKSSGPSFRFFSSRSAAPEQNAHEKQRDVDNMPSINSSDTKHVEDNRVQVPKDSSGPSFSFFPLGAASQGGKTGSKQGEENSAPVGKESSVPPFRFFTSGTVQKQDEMEKQGGDNSVTDGADIKDEEEGHHGEVGEKSSGLSFFLCASDAAARDQIADSNHEDDNRVQVDKNPRGSSFQVLTAESAQDLKGYDKQVGKGANLGEKIKDEEGHQSQVRKKKSGHSFLFFKPGASAHEKKAFSEQENDNRGQVDKKASGTSCQVLTSGPAQEHKRDAKQGDVDGRGVKTSIGPSLRVDRSLFDSDTAFDSTVLGMDFRCPRLLPSQPDQDENDIIAPSTSPVDEVENSKNLCRETDTNSADPTVHGSNLYQKAAKSLVCFKSIRSRRATEATPSKREKSSGVEVTYSRKDLHGIISIPSDLAGSVHDDGRDDDIEVPTKSNKHYTEATETGRCSRQFLYMMLMALSAAVIAAGVAVYFLVANGTSSDGPRIVTSSSVGVGIYISPSPSVIPSQRPSKDPLSPTLSPSIFPSPLPTPLASPQPSVQPSTARPTGRPSETPSLGPSARPSLTPSLRPSQSPSLFPSHLPSQFPTAKPTQTPTGIPTSNPTQSPSTSAPTTIGSVLRAIIADASAESAMLTSVEGTPQYDAFQWLAGNTDLSKHSPARIIQRYALVVFYYSTKGGSSWSVATGWLTDEDECSWFNFNVMPCSTGSGEIFSLELNQIGLQGTLPSELGLLTKLRLLRLSRNENLTGRIPASLGNLNRLQILELDDTGLSGGLPSELSRATNLVRIDLTGTPIEGTIPETIGELQLLDVLRLSNTAMYGAMPASVCDDSPPSVVEWNCQNTGPCPCCTYCCYLFIPYCGRVQRTP